MTAHVVAQQAKLLFEGRSLRIPHGKVCAERIGENQRRGGSRSREGVVQADAGQVGKRHGLPPYGGVACGFRPRICGGEHSVNKRLRGAEIVGRFEKLREGIRVEYGGSGGLGAKNFPEIATFEPCAAASLVDE